MNTTSETLMDRTVKLLTRDEEYKAILEKLFLLDFQHCGYTLLKTYIPKKNNL